MSRIIIGCQIILEDLDFLQYIVVSICFWYTSLWKAQREAGDLGDKSQKHIDATILYIFMVKAAQKGHMCMPLSSRLSPLQLLAVEVRVTTSAAWMCTLYAL